MSNKNKPIGNCRICGVHGPLSFEHVPPRAAFNNISIKGGSLEKNMYYLETNKFYGKISQKGAGYYTLCGKCNNFTGTSYVPAFVSFAFQGAYLLKRAGYKPTLEYPYLINPLRVIKEIIAMFFSVNLEGFNELFPELEKFVLNKEEKYLNPRCRIYIYFNYEGVQRYMGLQAVGSLNTGSVKTMSEISFPPFGYVLSIDSPPMDNLYEITYFANYSYDDLIHRYMKIPVYPTVTPFIGDYRTKKEVNEAIERDKKLMANMGKSA